MRHDILAAQYRGKMCRYKSWRDKNGSWLDFVAQRGIERVNK